MTRSEKAHRPRMNALKTLAAVAAILAVAGCTSAPTPTPPTPTPTWAPTPVTTIASEGELICREATRAERALVGVTGSAWAVDMGSGWRIVAWQGSVPGGAPRAFSVVTNGERYNYTYGGVGGGFSYRSLPIVFTDGFAAIELAESCAAKGRP